jgi:hypothetical protein
LGWIEWGERRGIEGHERTWTTRCSCRRKTATQLLLLLLLYRCRCGREPRLPCRAGQRGVHQRDRHSPLPSRALLYFTAQSPRSLLLCVCVLPVSLCVLRSACFVLGCPRNAPPKVWIIMLQASLVAQLTALLSSIVPPEWLAMGSGQPLRRLPSVGTYL